MKKLDKGFSLIEIMLAIALMFILLGAVYLSYFGVNNVFQFNSKKVEFHRSQRLITENIESYVRSAENINKADEDTVEMETTKGDITIGVDGNNYFYIEKVSTGNKRTLSDYKISEHNFSQKDGSLAVKLTVLVQGSEYSFEEYFYPRISNVGFSGF